MTIEITKNGDLKISVSSLEQAELLLQSNRQSFGCDDTMYELFENLVCNYEYNWIRPEDIGALTDAPILGTTDEHGDPDLVWGFMDYALRSPQEDLACKGYCIFQSGND